LPVEVKYSSDIKKEDFQNIFLFMDKFKVKKAIVVTANTFQRQKINNKKILFILAWIF